MSNAHASVQTLVAESELNRLRLQHTLLQCRRQLGEVTQQTTSLAVIGETAWYLLSKLTSPPPPPTPPRHGTAVWIQRLCQTTGLVAGWWSSRR